MGFGKIAVLNFVGRIRAIHGGTADGPVGIIDAHLDCDGVRSLNSSFAREHAPEVLHMYFHRVKFRLRTPFQRSSLRKSTW